MMADVKESLSAVLGALQNIFNHNQISVMLSIFLMIAASLIIIHMYTDLINVGMNDMLTLEKLVVVFIKTLVVFSLLIYLEDIITILFDIAIAFYEVLLAFSDSTTNTGLNGIMFLGHDLGQGFPEWELVMEDFNEAFAGGPLDFLNNISVFITLLIPHFLSGICKLACYFTAMSNALMLIVMVIFAPISVVNCFDEGMRSAGIRYLKTFLATALTFAVIVGVLYASMLINGAIMINALQANDITNIADSEALTAFAASFDIFYILTGIRLASVGVILKSMQIAKSVVGI